MIFFVLVFFQDEVKQLSSWKVFLFKMKSNNFLVGRFLNRFHNRFGNDVFELKELMTL